MKKKIKKMFLVADLVSLNENRTNYVEVMLQKLIWSNVDGRVHSGSVVECLTRDRGVAGSSLIGGIALWSLSKTHLS